MGKEINKKAVSKKAVEQETYIGDKGELRVKMDIDGVKIDREV